MQNIEILDFLGFCIQFHLKLRIPNDQDSVNTSTPDYLHQYYNYAHEFQLALSMSV